MESALNTQELKKILEKTLKYFIEQGIDFKETPGYFFWKYEDMFPELKFELIISDKDDVPIIQELYDMVGEDTDILVH